jgi:hypothetical protein
VLQCILIVLDVQLLQISDLFQKPNHLLFGHKLSLASILIPIRGRSRPKLRLRYSFPV